MPSRRRLDLEQLKLYIESHFPIPVLIGMYALYRRTAEHKRRQTALWEHLGRPEVIASGPFQGMAYIHEARGSALLPKVLGTYEKELEACVREIIARGPDLLIDIGAAEGYYAVGLARAIPSLSVVALDPDRYAQHLLRKLARLNGVSDRIRTRGPATAAEMDQLLRTARQPVIICDCEGAEDELLDPVRAPVLRRATILVELHETIRPGVSDRLRQRFSATHVRKTIQTQARTIDDFPLNLAIPPETKQAAMYELRGGLTMEWDYLVPRALALQTLSSRPTAR